MQCHNPEDHNLEIVSISFAFHLSFTNSLMGKERKKERKKKKGGGLKPIILEITKLASSVKNKLI